MEQLHALIPSSLGYYAYGRSRLDVQFGSTTMIPGLEAGFWLKLQLLVLCLSRQGNA